MPARDAPVNIDSTIMGDADLKCESTCALSFDYSTSTCNLYNEGDHLRIPYDPPSGTYPVTYSGVQYKAEYLHIYRPSLHTYDGVRADAELLVYHTSASGNNLIICIPIMKGGGGGKISSDYFNQILQEIPPASSSSSSGHLVSGISNFNLGNIIPRQPFFSYVGKHLVPQYTGVYNYVVFHKNNAITVLNDSVNSLTRAISSTASAGVLPTNTVFYNPRGPNNAKGSSEIYIKCNPTGEDGRILYQTNSSSAGGAPSDSADAPKGLDWKELMNSEAVQIALGLLMGGIVGVILFFVAKQVLKKFGNRSGGGGGGGDGGVTPAAETV